MYGSLDLKVERSRRLTQSNEADGGREHHQRRIRKFREKGDNGKEPP